MNRIAAFFAPNQRKKYVFPALVFVIAATVIWYGAAYFKLGQFAPFVQAERRLLLIALLLAGFAYKLFYLDMEEVPPAHKSGPQPPFLQKNIQVLENRLHGAVTFLRRTRLNNNGKRYALDRLPWFLVVGAAGSGKTSMLANSKVKFILDRQFKDDNVASISHSESCDWWVTRDLVMVDVPGAYVTVKSKELSMTNRLWLSFLDMVKTERAKSGLAGVVLTLSVADLMHPKRREQGLRDLRGSIAALKDKFGHELPFHIVVTKCDLLPGFMDFFSECSQEELAQAWGVSMPAIPLGASLHDIFARRFNALVRRLNQQLLLRLHQERNSFTRIYIKDFPLQIERLKDRLTEALQALTVKDNFNLKGVYLTSAVQSAENGNMAEPPQVVPGDEFQRSLQIMRQPAMPAQSCFIKQFILHSLVPPRRFSYTTTLTTNIKRMIYDNRGKQ